MRKVINHISHGLGDHVTGNRGGTLGRNGAPKKIAPIMVHPGMVTRTASSGDAYSGQHKSALDSLTGATVPTGRGTASAPGWGQGTVRSGNPMAHAPASKNLRPVAIKPGMRSRTSNHTDDQLAELGRAVLAQAVTNK